ncbi:hypothetical protein DL770_007880 [Monosporascus sp. CRB-9-2]|nr:hypothetical protein DL770_007880 [Monosporascus sp. CRB-9-2]
MKFIVAPASSQTGRVAVQALLNDKSAPLVVGIYRNLGKVPAGFSSYPNFKAVQGDLTDPSSLDFAGVDGVVVMTPPKYDGSDVIAHARVIAENVRDAVSRASSVKRLVYISSGGAQHSQGVGEIRTNHVSETIYQGAAAEVVFMRNAYFMENWVTALDTIKADPPHFYSTLTPLDHKIPMVKIFAYPIREEPSSLLTRDLFLGFRRGHRKNLRKGAPRIFFPAQPPFNFYHGTRQKTGIVESGIIYHSLETRASGSRTRERNKEIIFCVFSYQSVRILELLEERSPEMNALITLSLAYGANSIWKNKSLAHEREDGNARVNKQIASQVWNFMTGEDMNKKSNKKGDKRANHPRLSPEETVARHEESVNHAAAGLEAVDLSDPNTRCEVLLTTLVDRFDKELDRNMYEENNTVPSTADVGMPHALMILKDAQARI